MWCPAARCCRLRRVVCLCVGSHRNSHCVRTAGAGWVRRSARTLPVGRVVVYARVVVCEDYLTNTLSNTQRGVSPSSLARGTRSESQTHTPISLATTRERTHTDPMCRARPALPQARNDPSCAPCAYARKHMRLLTSYSSTLRHTPPEDSASSVHRGGGAAARAQVGEAVNDPRYEAWNCRQRCGLRAKVSRLEGGRAVGRSWSGRPTSGA